VDWARDVYRPSIITQLSSLATGINFDEVSLGPDTDIVSKEKTIWDWIPHSDAGTAVQYEVPQGTEEELMDPESHNDILSLKPTEFGRVRSVSATIFQLIGLRVTEGNVESLLTLLDTPHSNDQRGNTSTHSQLARRLVNEISRYDEVLVVLGADLDDIERVWTDEEIIPATFDEDLETEFYVVFEYRCFINLARDIVRDLSYMAISKMAFDILVKHAAFRIRHPGIASFPNKLRQCPGSLIKDAINCLRSGSQWQVLLSAISSTLLSIYPQQEEKGDGSRTPVASLGFGYPRSVRVRFFVETSILKKAARVATKLKKQLRSSDNARKRFKTTADAWDEKTYNQSFRRTYQRTVRSPEALHDPSECNRCRSSNQDLFALTSWDQQNIPMLTAYGANLVASLEEEPDAAPANRYRQRHDLTLFVLEESLCLDDEVSVSTVVQDLAQDSSIYHTILHEPSTEIAGFHATVWNLPTPYRKSTRRQSWDVTRWVEELNGQYSPDWKIPTQSLAPWIHQQILLHYLRNGMPYDDALAALLRYRNEKKAQLYDRLREAEEFRKEGKYYWKSTDPDCVRLTSFWNDMRLSQRCEQQGPVWLPQNLRLRGD
jgi:hypothetical protein